MPDTYDLTGVHGAEIYRTLPAGLSLKLKDGAIARIIENPGDGAYLLAAIVESPAQPERVGSEEMIYFLDVEGVLE